MTNIFCVKCKRKTATTNGRVIDGKPPRITGKCSTCGTSKTQFTSREKLAGAGLILGPNSPFKNIPLIGMLL